MKTEKLSIHAKTNLSTDGRVLGWIETIQSNPNKNYSIAISLYSSGLKKAPINDVKINLITNKFIPKWKHLAILRFIFYVLQDFLFLVMYRPKTMIVQDKNALIAPLLYKLLLPKKKLVYDDHELFNFPLSFEDKILFMVENFAFKISDVISVANEFRKRIIEKIHRINTKIFVIENYYYPSKLSSDTDSEKTIYALEQIKKIKDNGKTLVLHQGRIMKERGESRIKQIIEEFPTDFHLIFIGEERYDFQRNLVGNNYSSLGLIPYNELHKIYSEICISIIFYENNFINNKYCAPNRLYMSIYFNHFIITNNNRSIISTLEKLGNEYILHHKNHFVVQAEELRTKKKIKKDVTFQSRNEQVIDKILRV